MDDKELQAAADQMRWFHSIELRPGVVTQGGKTRELLAAEEAAVLGHLSLADRSVLDIGAWNGFWSFAAKRRGAARVLAMDYATWRWEGFRGRETFDLAREALGLDIEALEQDVTTLDPAAIGRFDVVLFLGVFYHLFDPIPVMRTLRAVTASVLVIETHQDLLREPRPAMVFYPGGELAGDPTNWWGPNPPLILALLREAGFGPVFYQDHPVYGRKRGIFHAFTSAAAASDAATQAPAWLDVTDPSALAALARAWAVERRDAARIGRSGA